MCEPAAFDFIGKKLGVDAATQVVVYDAGMGVNASGDWFFLTLYGHQNVKILEGGLAAWKAKGGAIEEGKGKAPGAKAGSASISAKAERVRMERDSLIWVKGPPCMSRTRGIRFVARIAPSMQGLADS